MKEELDKNILGYPEFGGNGIKKKFEFDINTTEGAKTYLESEGLNVDEIVKEGRDFIESVKKRIEFRSCLPTDKEVEEWYDLNINDECSVSSAIYKFRLWLKHLYIPTQPPKES